ncbi:MAG: transporter substrate-binding domain-containing protein [Butyrivibrio sp.]|nr:transporter substrate-binding domain-containing protein [Butyrivibrio sp.]
MKNITVKRLIATLVAATSMVAVVGCGAQDSAAQVQANEAQPASANEEEKAPEAEAEQQKDVTVIRYAYRSPGLWPTAGEDDQGNPTGYDIEVLKIVDEALDDIDFEFIPTSYDDCYVGLEAGNFDAADTNAFYTPERAEQYYLTEENIGQTVLYLVVSKENADIKSFEDLYDSGKQLAPIKAGNGMYYVAEAYNDAHPDKALELRTTDDDTYVGGGIEELLAGKYDASIWTKNKFDATVLAEDGELHNLLGEISYTAFDVAKTYPVFSRSVDYEIVKKISDAIGEVKKSGKASELAQEFYGYDIFDLSTVN